MLGLLVALGIGAVIGLVRGGSFKQLERVRLKSLPLIFAAVAVQVLAGIFAEPMKGRLSLGLVLVAFALVFAFAFLNRTLIGMPLVAAGALANFVVIAANAGMPVSLDALRRAGARNPFAGSGSLVKGGHRPLTDDSRLTFLADVIPMRLGPNVVSVGDLLIWAGLALLLQHLMVGPRGRHHAPA